MARVALALLSAAALPLAAGYTGEAGRLWRSGRVIKGRVMSEPFPTEPQPMQVVPPAAPIVPEGQTTPCVIKVVGVGGGGGNAVSRMVETQIRGVDFWSVNTDAQALTQQQVAHNTLNIGASVTRGLGAGANPSTGQRAAEESRDAIAEIVRGADLVFVTAGMGGGTGTGAAPIVAEVAKDLGALTVGVVTKPFRWEGKRRTEQADEGIAELQGKVDTLIVISNDKLTNIIPDGTPINDAFLVADDILRQGVVGISEIIIKPGLVNVDFADVRTVMGNAGTALMGIGTGRGKTRAQDAAIAAISSPLLDFPVKAARGVVFNCVGGPDLSLTEIQAAADVIYENVDPDCNIIFGAMIDERMSTEVSITVLATGFDQDVIDAGFGAPAAKAAAQRSEDATPGAAEALPSPRRSLQKQKKKKSSLPGFLRRII